MLEKVFLESKWRRSLLSEFIGTTFLVATIVLANTMLSDRVSTAMAITAQVVGYTYVGAGFLNPAIAAGVTLVRIRRATISNKPGGTKLAVVQCLSFFAVEVVSGFFGAVVAYGMLGTSAQRDAFPAPEPNDGNDSKIPRAMLAEFVFTFQLVYVMVFTCVAKEYDRVNVNRFLGPALGCVVFVGNAVAGPVSGAGLNPAVVTALQGMQCILQVGPSATNNCRPLSFLWMYWIVEIFAGLSAGLCFLLASNEADPSMYDEVFSIEESMRTDAGGGGGGGAPESGMDDDHGLPSPRKSLDQPLNIGGPRSAGERDSLIRRRRSSAAFIRPRQVTLGGMQTLVDLE